MLFARDRGYALSCFLLICCKVFENRGEYMC